MDLTQHPRRRVYERLMAAYRLDRDEELELRWQWLMAAHIVGQRDWRLHLHSHAAMLMLGLGTRDLGEACGQLLRMAVLPLGHALGRLPAGNVGRATVSAFRPMRPPMHVRRLIALAARG